MSPDKPTPGTLTSGFFTNARLENPSERNQSPVNDYAKLYEPQVHIERSVSETTFQEESTIQYLQNSQIHINQNPSRTKFQNFDTAKAATTVPSRETSREPPKA